MNQADASEVTDVKCPSCGSTFPITEAIQTRIVEQRELRLRREQAQQN